MERPHHCSCGWILPVLLIAGLAGTPGPARANGSCNSVGANSVCIDYSGRYWAGNMTAMRAHCQDPGATLSRVGCDLSEPFGAARFGSCIYNQFHPSEFIAHFYTIGGGGFDDPAFDFDMSRIVCENTRGSWVWGPRSGR